MYLTIKSDKEIQLYGITEPIPPSTHTSPPSHPASVERYSIKQVTLHYPTQNPNLLIVLIQWDLPLYNQSFYDCQGAINVCVSQETLVTRLLRHKSLSRIQENCLKEL